jgi:hypothetical protein
LILTLYEFIEQSARAALTLQGGNGAMPPGHNGPYLDPETPVRNTAHWLITFLKAYELTGDKQFYLASERAVSFLTGASARPMQASFWCRKNPEKNFSNGLVGQAWVIEALIYACKPLSRDDLIKLAEDVFLLHPQDLDSGCWRIVNVDGSYGTLDFTLNHQIWFAAAGALIAQVNKNSVEANVLSFLDKLDDHLALYNSGLIKHTSISFPPPTALSRIRYLWSSLPGKPSRGYMKMKSEGYHGFNLYGLTLLHTVFPEHRFWSTLKLKRVLDYTETENYRNGVAKSTYGYPYNPPGFEITYAMEKFQRGSKEIRQKWVQEQINYNFDFHTKLLERNTKDSNTMAARLYEATRLGNYSITIES